MNRKTFALMMLAALVGALALSACSGAAPMSGSVDQFSPGYDGGKEAYEMDYAAEESTREYTNAVAPMDAPAANYATVERIVIKNASLAITVDNPEESMKRISAMAEEMGGYVVSANLYQSYRSDGTQVPTASLTVRIPAERLTEAMDRIKSETELPVRSENISSDDVTQSYTDLQSRLRNLEAAEKQLQAIMDEAKKTEDVLSVYSQLVSIREQIEVIKGQIKYYEESAALSAISVELAATAASQPIQVGGWQPEGTVKEAIQSLIYAFQSLVEFLIWLVLFFLPILIAIAIPVWLVILVIRRLRRGRQKPASS